MKLRRIRRRTYGSWTPESSAKAHAAKARKRMESPPESEPLRVPAGEHLGCLTWLDASGSAHRWAIKQGPRANNVAVHVKGAIIICGWDKLMSSLRRRLARPKRILPSLL